MDREDVARQAIEAMQVEAASFSMRWINDNAVRQNYMRTTAAYARELMDAVRRGEISPDQAAQQANQVRNEILAAARLRTSDVGRAAAEQMKAQGKTLNELVEHYAAKNFNKPASALTVAERDQVFLAIVESSGRARPAVTIRAGRFAALGRGLLVITIAVAVYNVATADDKLDAAGHEAAAAGGGILGGMAMGAAAGLVCGPGAPVCVGIGVFVGGVAGALGADFLYSWGTSRHH